MDQALDPAALKVTLARLGATMPAAAPLVGEALASAGAALTAGRSLAAEGQRALAVADESVQVAEGVVAGFAAFAGERRSALAEGYATVEAKVVAFADLDPVVATVDGATTQVETAFESFRGKLAGGAQAAEKSSEAFTEKVEALLTTAEQCAEELGLSLEVAKVAFGELQDGLQGGQDAVLAEVDAFVDELVAREDEAVAATDEYLANGWQANTRLVEQLEQDYPELIGADVAQALEQAQAGIQEYVQTLVREAMDKVVGACKDFEKKVEEADEASKLARRVLEPLFEDFGRVAEPLVRSLESIRDAGRTVGVDL
jgi:hypothetical protein